MPRPRAERPTYSITLRGKSYYIQWWQDGRARRVSCRTADKGEARRFLAEFKVGIDAPQIPASPTVGALLKAYQHDREKKPHSQTLGYCCSALARHLGDLPVNLLGSQQTEQYVTDRRTDGAGGAAAKYRKSLRPLSDGTLIRELGVLRRALAWAVAHQWIATAPYIDRPSAPPARERWLTHDEVDRLLKATESPHIQTFIVLAICTGARSGALLELTWDHVDLKSGLINLGAARGRKRRATVPIADDLLPVLKQARNIATTPFVVEFGGRPVASIKTGFRAAVRRARLSGVTPNVCRHTAATWMVQSGIPTAQVARFLGNTEAMVERVYGHHSPEYLRRAVSALSLKPRQLAEETGCGTD